VDRVHLVLDKKQLLSGGGERTWLSSVKLDSELAVPFIAGLLDGDGFCLARFHGKGVFGHVDAGWYFYQKSYPFLAEFLLEYVLRISRTGAMRTTGREGIHNIVIRRAGRLALLERGIARWSFRVAKFLRDSEAISRRIADAKSRFLTPSEVVKRLHVDITTVTHWCKLNYVRHVRVRGGSCSAHHYRCLLPVEEVERLERERKESGG
jgi:hypothetical protein